ncbi:MAG TPA: AraC family transcriptional regulator [Stellaceae bacterium]|nr:AraC family transcriptional regulator [Stellaceae bacterium]
MERIEAYFAGHAYDPHRHDTYSLGYTLGGVQTFDYCGARVDSRAGNVIVLHPDEIHDGRAGAQGGFRYRMLYLEPRLVRDALGDGASALPFVRAALTTDERLRQVLRMALADLDRPLEPLETDQVVLGVSEALLALDPSARNRASSATCSFAIERARQFLEEHSCRVVASEELEGLTGLDRYALARHFRTRLGTSPYRYLTMRRLDHAKRLMRTDLSLAEAAVESGFADQSHMTRQFKRAYGLSPGRWRSLSYPAPSAA